MKIVAFNDGRPPLNDIPGRLRLLADQIEAGEHGECNSCLVILPQVENKGYPGLFGFGSIDSPYEPTMSLELAKLWWLNRHIGD